MRRNFMTGGALLAEAPATKSLPPGFRFHPTDEELVNYYLKRKVLNKPCFDAIGEVDINKHEPYDLPVYSKLKTKDQEWYFFSTLDKKYGTGIRMNRKTKKGYWKTTGKDREVRRGEVEVIGMIKIHVFYNGRAPDGLRTNWVMHEYRLVEDEPEINQALQQGTYVLCKVFLKNEIWEGNVSDANGSNEDNNDDDESPKRESAAEDRCIPLCVLNNEAPLPLVQYKRKRQIDSTGNSSNSNGTTKDNDSSTTTSLETTSSAVAADTAIAAALLHFSGCFDKMKNLLLKIEPEPEPETVATMLPAANSSTKLINDLQKENQQIVVERETLKLDLMKAEMMIEFLQRKINALREENEELREKGK